MSAQFSRKYPKDSTPEAQRIDVDRVEAGHTLEFAAIWQERTVELRAFGVRIEPVRNLPAESE